MNCTTWREKIYDYCYELLEDQELLEFREHLTNCGSCKALLTKQRQGLSLLKAWTTSANDGLHNQTMTAIRRLQRLHRLGISAVWAVAASVLILLGVHFIVQDQHQSPDLQNRKDASPLSLAENRDSAPSLQSPSPKLSPQAPMTEQPTLCQNIVEKKSEVKAKEQAITPASAPGSIEPSRSVCQEIVMPESASKHDKQSKAKSAAEAKPDKLAEHGLAANKPLPAKPPMAVPVLAAKDINAFAENKDREARRSFATEAAMAMQEADDATANTEKSFALEAEASPKLEVEEAKGETKAAGAATPGICPR